jgi:hypothetical protein
MGARGGTADRLGDVCAVHAVALRDERRVPAPLGDASNASRVAGSAAGGRMIRQAWAHVTRERCHHAGIGETSSSLRGVGGQFQQNVNHVIVAVLSSPRAMQ